MADTDDIFVPIVVERSARVVLWRKQILAVVVALLALVVVGVIWHGRSSSPVPPSIRSSVPFEIYYPDPKKLPQGYALDISSFRVVQPQVVLFWVTNSNDQKLTFSEERPPSSSIIDKFLSTSIPLRTSLGTNVGKAEVGAIGSGSNLQTLASLQINKGPWLIITAPSSTNPDVLKQVIQSLKK